MSDWNTGLMFIVYVVSKALTKCMSNYKTIYFQKSVTLGGLGFGSKELSDWQMYSIFPSFIILFA